MINQVTNGLTQKTVPATELGYSLTISFGGYISDGSYKEVRNGIPARNGSFSAVSSESGSIKDVLRYPADTTQQSFDLRALSERIPKSTTLSYGSAYRYQR